LSQFALNFYWNTGFKKSSSIGSARQPAQDVGGKASNVNISTVQRFFATYWSENLSAFRIAITITATAEGENAVGYSACGSN
jgi:hypothetical protein